MNQFQRFTTSARSSPEARLLAAGREEGPDAAAFNRAALRLGLTNLAVGATIATTTSVASSATVAGSAAAALPSSSSSLLVASFIKATAVGLALGAGTLGGVQVVTHWQAKPPAVKVAAAPPRPQTQPPIPRSSPVNAATPEPNESLPSEQPPAPPILPKTRQSIRAPESHREPPRQFTAPAGTGEPAAAIASADFGLAAHRAAPASNAKTHLGSEVESLDRARTAVSRGDAAGALRELDEFARHQPYRLLASEVMLVRIEALLTLGHRIEAAAIARQLLQQGAPAPQRKRLEQLAASE